MLDLDYSRPLRLWYTVDHWAFDDLESRLLRECYPESLPEAAPVNLRVLLANLYAAWCDDPELSVAIAKSNSGYRKKTRYNGQKASAFLIKVADRLFELDLIGQAVGFYDRNRKTGKRTRVWPVGRLRQEFDRLVALMVKPIVASKTECLVLRDADGNDMRQVLTDYNQMLARTFIDIRDLEVPKLQLGGRSYLSVSQSDKFVHRVFNRSSWQKGGRFYGGWWQRCPKEWRKRIFINDHPTIEDDYSGLHIVMLYGWEGIDFWANAEPDEDPYRVDVPELALDPVTQRRCAKTLMLIAVNAESEKSAFKAFRSSVRDDGEWELGALTDRQLALLLDALRRKHAPIAYRLGAGAGIDLMNQDSRITEYIIKRFLEAGRPVLSIHDSYIVTFGDDGRLRDTLHEAFEYVTGIKGVQLKREGIGYHQIQVVDADGRVTYSEEADRLSELINTPRSPGYVRRMERFFSH
ncbi:hypothetical protein [uncultured Roseibium sp.]|uniref:hypothetical protein n=1 Tax=uncultured Roseibium sp. TaxID=1936171 RepID=UPI0032168F36